MKKELRYSSVVEHMPSLHKALDSIFSTRWLLLLAITSLHVTIEDIFYKNWRIFQNKQKTSENNGTVPSFLHNSFLSSLTEDSWIFLCSLCCYMLGLKWYSTFLTSARPWVQTPLLPGKKNVDQAQLMLLFYVCIALYNWMICYTDHI
jgi:hypothetical protein